MHTLGGPATTINNYQPWTFLNHFNIGKFNPDLFGFISFLIRISFDKTLQISSKGSAVCDWLSHPLPNYAKLMFANESFNDTWIPKENLLILSRGNKSWHLIDLGGSRKQVRPKPVDQCEKSTHQISHVASWKETWSSHIFPWGIHARWQKRRHKNIQVHVGSCWIYITHQFLSLLAHNILNRPQA